MNRRSLFKSIIGAAIAPQILDAESVAKKHGFLVGVTPYDPMKYLGTWKWVSFQGTHRGVEDLRGFNLHSS